MAYADFTDDLTLLEEVQEFLLILENAVGLQSPPNVPNESSTKYLPLKA